MTAVGSATVTAKSGPAIQTTAVVFTNVIDMDIQISRGMLFLYFSDKPPVQYELASVTTFTATLSGAGGNWTVTVS